LDICVLSQQRIDRADIVVPARVVGGIQLLDGGEADDKIVAILASDTVFDYANNLKNLPTAVINRLVHYFATYKMDISGETENAIEVVGTYGADHARDVINASIEDYNQEYGGADGDRRQS
jgi:inorganic pyrophosphatase